MNEHNIGQAKVSSTDIKPKRLIIANGAVTPEKLSERVVEELIKPLVAEGTEITEEMLANYKCQIQKIIADMQNQINGIHEGGVAVSNEFGTNPYISISQKTITDAISRIWGKLDELTGEPSEGIIMTVTPAYFIGDGCEITIQANSAGGGIFEAIAFYINDEKVVEKKLVEYMEHTTHINQSCVITCKAKIMGIEYTETREITRYEEFFLGGGATYEDVMDAEHSIPTECGLRGNYDVAVGEGQHIIIVLGASMADGFMRADMNGFEIPFSIETVTVRDNEYKVFTSSNTYHAGTYNIDIEGKCNC